MPVAWGSFGSAFAAAQGLIGGRVVAAAVRRHAEGQRLLASPRPNVAAVRPHARRRFEIRLVGGRQDAAHPSRASGEPQVADFLGECEDSPARGGEVLLPAEPGLEGGDRQCELRVLRTGRGQHRQMVEGVLRASGGDFPIREEIEVEPGREVVLAGPRRRVAFPMRSQFGRVCNRR